METQQWWWWYIVVFYYWKSLSFSMLWRMSTKEHYHISDAHVQVDVSRIRGCKQVTQIKIVLPDCDQLILNCFFFHPDHTQISGHFINRKKNKSEHSITNNFEDDSFFRCNAFYSKERKKLNLPRKSSSSTYGSRLAGWCVSEMGILAVGDGGPGSAAGLNSSGEGGGNWVKGNVCNVENCDRLDKPIPRAPTFRPSPVGPDELLATGDSVVCPQAPDQKADGCRELQTVQKKKNEVYNVCKQPDRPNN